MVDTHRNQSIIEALEKVEHPAIATTLSDLGIIRDIEISPEGKVTLTLILPFPNVPDNIRDYMVGSLAAAAQSAKGELIKVNLAFMNEEERQNFLIKEQLHWRDK
jgi:metal-sulfur cluster biosynthetic enzyme